MWRFLRRLWWELGHDSIFFSVRFCSIVSLNEPNTKQRETKAAFRSFPGNNSIYCFRRVQTSSNTHICFDINGPAIVFKRTNHFFCRLLGKRYFRLCHTAVNLYRCEHNIKLYFFFEFRIICINSLHVWNSISHRPTKRKKYNTFDSNNFSINEMGKHVNVMAN